MSTEVLKIKNAYQISLAGLKLLCWEKLQTLFPSAKQNLKKFNK